LNSAGDIQGLTPNLSSGQWQGRGPLSAAIQMAGIPTGWELLCYVFSSYVYIHRSGVSNSRPARRMQPAKVLFAARHTL